jgi:hypothetical protein
LRREGLNVNQRRRFAGARQQAKFAPSITGDPNERPETMRQ